MQSRRKNIGAGVFWSVSNMKRRKIVRQMNNAGSTMVEVILVMVLAECMVHLLGVSGELVKKSKDMQEEQRILNEEMYRTDTVFETLADTGITLTVDTNKTDSQNMAQATSFAIEAKLHRYYSDRADLTVFRVIHKSEEAGE